MGKPAVQLGYRHGGEFFSLYAYYLASPVNWLLILCPKQFIIEFMTLMIVLKIGLSGLLCMVSEETLWHKGTSAWGFLAFLCPCGYMAAYSWNIMWLDCILLFPLILLGLEALVKEKKGALYCITLGLSILSNYYISIMICIFMVIYVIAQMIINPPKELWGVCGNWAALCLVFPSGRRSCRGGAFAGDLCAAGNGFRGF